MESIIPASGGGGVSSPPAQTEVYIAGRWYPTFQGSGNSTVTEPNARLALTLFRPRTPLTIDRLAIAQASAADASGVHTFSLYEFQAEDPILTLIDSFGSIASSGISAGQPAIGSGPSSPVELDPDSVYAAGWCPQGFASGGPSALKFTLPSGDVALLSPGRTAPGWSSDTELFGACGLIKTGVTGAHPATLNLADISGNTVPRLCWFRAA